MGMFKSGFSIVISYGALAILILGVCAVILLVNVIPHLR
jgi:hypothetical protein